MFIFRVVCAILMAWAVNIALGLHPDGKLLLETFPDMRYFAPAAGALVGFFVLARRQGWGPLVAFANGIWGGILSIIVAALIFMGAYVFQAYSSNAIKDFDGFVRILNEAWYPLQKEGISLPLVIFMLGAGAIVGVVTETVHWVLHKINPPKADGPTPTSSP